MRVCVIGCGNVGKTIAEHKDYIGARLRFYDRNIEKCRNICKGCEYSANFEDFLKGCDVIVEAASPSAVSEYVPVALEVGPVVVLSAGALLDEDLLALLIKKSESTGNEIVVPSGAIGGLDALKAMRLVGVDELIITTVKNPRSLGVEVDTRTVVFDGPAKLAVKRYPLNVNVVAAASLAAGREARVKVIADPTVNKNVHEILAKSKASELHVRVINEPSPNNPRTSYLAALSIIETLRNLVKKGGLRVGT